MIHRVKKPGDSGITRRWIAVGVLSTAVILVIATAAIIISLRQSYYASARQAIEWRVSSAMRAISASGSSRQDRVSALHSLVEDFAEKDRFEFMLVDSGGRILVTSSGFSPANTEPLDDYSMAVRNADGQAVYIGYSPNREHIIAVTQLLDSPIGDAEAIRFASSLRGVDEQLIKLTELIVVVDLVVMMFTIYSGLYFIRSIVIPIGEIGQTASRIADGDYDVRIENHYDDEIGELCNIINDMASGLSQTTRMKNEFVSSVSHELRTPLTSIKGWAETLSVLGQDDRENIEKGIRIIISETDRLSVLVEDLLDFSRLESSALKVQLAPLNLMEELRAAVQTVEMRARRMRLHIRLDSPYDELPVRADKNRMRQVFANIFDNAIKYSEPGGKITVTVGVQDGFVHIATRDTGRGIPPEDLARISTRFFKASNSVTGSGIGLAVVKEIVTTHGGALHFDSTLGEGTTVTVSLPLLAHNEE